MFNLKLEQEILTTHIDELRSLRNLSEKREEPGREA